jgi:hypothetical protein
LRDADGGRQTRLARPHLPRRVFAEVSERFFFEKRRKKPLLFWPMAVKPSWSERIKVFLLLFCSQKEDLTFASDIAVNTLPHRTIVPRWERRTGTPSRIVPAGGPQP